MNGDMKKSFHKALTRLQLIHVANMLYVADMVFSLSVSYEDHSLSQIMNISVGYDSSHPSQDFENSEFLMMGFEKLDSIAKTGTQVEFETWLAHTIDPTYKTKQNHENLKTSRRICEILAGRKRVDLLTYFSSHHFFFGATSEILFSDELISDDCIPLYEWFYSNPENTDTDCVHIYGYLIRKALDLQQMQLYNWILNNIPNFSIYWNINQLISNNCIDKSYTSLKLFCSKFPSIYIAKEYKSKLIHYENAFQILQDFIIPELIDLIKLYC